MGVGRADEGTVPHALEHDVSDVLTFANQQSLVFATYDRLADTLGMHERFLLNEL